MPYIRGLQWDEGAEDHISRHGVVFSEVEEAIADIRYAKRSRGYLQVIGQTEAGRYLTVILDEEDDEFWYPVTARSATANEKRLIRRRTQSEG